jgi:hypothetical protein
MHRITHCPCIIRGLFTALALALILPLPAAAGESLPDIDPVLRPAEALFASLQKKDYAQAWSYLSQKSKGAIIGRITAGSGPDPVPVDAVAQDLATGGKLSRAYWDSFLERFDPRMILEQSRWESVTLDEDRADIRITHKKAGNPLLLRMFREDGVWKVGFAETFL